MGTSDSNLPPVRRRALIIGFGLALLWFIGDINALDWEDMPRWVVLYFSVGVSTSLSLWIALSLHEERSAPTTDRARATGQFLVTLVALIPGLGLPALLDSYLSEEPVLFSELWGTFLYGVITAAMFHFHYASKKATNDLMELRAKSAEANYEILKAQMQPHFLFNSLNSLAELIPHDALAAEEMAQKLSDLYKLILRNSDSRTASLSSEIAIARKYLEIERLRFEDRLRFELSVPVEAERIQLPSLMIQTLVENAVKHGIANSMQGGKISLEVVRAGNGWYRLNLSNTGEPFEKLKPGTGLSNTVGRLNLLYGDKHDFRVTSDNDNRTMVSFRFSGEALV